MQINADQLQAVIYAPDTADDIALFAMQLSGDDTFKLSAGNCVAMGYGGNDTMSGKDGDDCWTAAGARTIWMAASAMM